MYHQEKAPRLDGRPDGQPKGEYRPHVVTPSGSVDIIAYVQEHGHGLSGPRAPGAGPPFDLFDGPLPGQSFEDWKRQVQGGYYTP